MSGDLLNAADDLLRTAYLVVWDLAEAEDLVQESLMRVAKRWPRVRAKRCRRFAPSRSCAIRSTARRSARWS